MIKSNEATIKDRTPAIEIRGLSKTFGKGDKAVQAVRDLDLHVEAGQVFSFPGPNGAGKTTSIRRLDRLSPNHLPTSGVDGMNTSWMRYG